MVTERPASRDVGVQCAVWSRSLYDVQPFDDDYVNPHFLEDFIARIRDAYPLQRYWFMAVGAAGAVAQHVCFLGLVLAVWFRCCGQMNKTNVLFKPQLNFNELMLSNIIIFSLGFLYHHRHTLRNKERFSIATSNSLRRAGSVTIFVMIFTPVLKDLSESFHSDTIFALTILMFVLHLLFHDYSFILTAPSELFDPLDASQNNKTSAYLTRRIHCFEQGGAGVIGLTAATYAVALLASRLEGVLEVFAFIVFALIVFSLSPIVVRDLRHTHAIFYFGFWLPTLIAGTTLSLIGTCNEAIQLFLGSLFGITFIVPAVFVMAQNFRADMRGPWDIPVIKTA